MPIVNEVLEEFGAFLEVKMGLHFPKKRKADLEKKLSLISQAFNFTDPDSCLRWLKKTPLDAKQIETLARHLTIGETYFFRDASFFSCLEKVILPEIIQRRQKERTLKIWSAGCCTGEELYSIAILLHRLIPNLNEWNLILLGTDINSQFLQKAKNATYKKWSFRATPKEVLEHYFIKNHDSYTLIPKIKNLVSFMPFNLVEDSYPDSEMDLIVCHNVLMYFSENQIKKAVHQLTKALNKQGILSLASIEVPFVSEKNLTPFKCPGVIYHKKGIHHSPPPALPKPPIITKPRVEPKQKKPAVVKEIEKDIYQECVQAYNHKHYNQVISKLTSFIEKKPLSKHLKEVQLLIWTYANSGDLKKGLEWCEKALDTDKLQPITHYLYATLLEAKGDIPGAIKSLKAALFIDPHFIMAHYLLGLLEKQIDNPLAALRHIKIAKELIENGSIDVLEVLPHENLKNLIADHYESFRNIT